MPNLKKCFTIEDLAKKAKKQIPYVAFDYINRGSDSEVTLTRNAASFNFYEFKPRVLINIENINLNKSIMGVTSTLPIAIASTGMSRMFHWQGEKAVIRAAEKAGIPYTLSTVATTSIEELAQESPQTSKFFQIYIWKNRDWVYEFIERCKANDYRGFMLAVDVPTLGNRLKDKRNGHGTNRLKLNMGLGALLRPRWLFHFLTKGRMLMANLKHVLPYEGEAEKVIDEINEQFDATLTWTDAEDLKNRIGKLPFLLKGIQSVEDAIAAKEKGFTGVILSNHGGRQLDSAPTALELLPLVREAVGLNFEIIIDGGITCGADIIKALCLGADSCMIGKAYLYGLAAGGEKGVSKTLSILKEEMIRTMRLIGCTDVNKLNESFIRKL